jgi:PIN domain nuclease of toxin-antitoxin system
MNLLLDTHTLIWFLEGDSHLGFIAKSKCRVYKQSVIHLSEFKHFGA